MDGNGGSKAMTRRLEEMRVAALERFGHMRAGFDKLRGESWSVSPPAWSRSRRTFAP